jgi:hypothetical protein
MGAKMTVRTAVRARYWSIAASHPTTRSRRSEAREHGGPIMVSLRLAPAPEVPAGELRLTRAGDRIAKLVTFDGPRAARGLSRVGL